MRSIVRTAHRYASKVAAGRIFIAPALERGRANHHPCPLLKGGELRGKQEDRERTAESIIKAAGLGKRTLGQEAPPPKRGRGTGWGQMRRCSLQASCNPAPGRHSLSGRGVPTRRGLGAQPQAYFGSFCTHKRNITAASRTDYAFVKKAPRRRRRDGTGLVSLRRGKKREPCGSLFSYVVW